MASGLSASPSGSRLRTSFSLPFVTVVHFLADSEPTSSISHAMEDEHDSMERVSRASDPFLIALDPPNLCSILAFHNRRFLPPFGSSVVVFTTGVIGFFRDAACFPLLALSFHQQSFFMCFQALQRRQYPAKYSVALPLALPLSLPFFFCPSRLCYFRLACLLPSPSPYREIHGHSITSGCIRLCSVRV